LHHLQQTLEDGRPHVLVLDGIELVQEARDGGAQRPRGILTDPLLKRLLRAVAAGLGNARAIITSRFPLRDMPRAVENLIRPCNRRAPGPIRGAGSPRALWCSRAARSRAAAPPAHEQCLVRRHPSSTLVAECPAT
jgi:hypothetical protein